LFGTAIGIVVNWVVGKAFDFIGQVFADDVFPPVVVNARVRSLSQRFADGRNDSPEHVVDFRGHNGQYRVTYDWLVA